MAKRIDMLNPPVPERRESPGTVTNIVPALPRTRPVLGCKFQGRPSGYASTEDGIYWEVLPPVVDKEQKALLARLPRAEDEHIRHLWRTTP